MAVTKRAVIRTDYTPDEWEWLEELANKVTASATRLIANDIFHDKIEDRWGPFMRDFLELQKASDTFDNIRYGIDRANEQREARLAARKEGKK